MEEKTPEDIEYVKTADGTFMLDKDGNKVRTKRQRQKDNDEARRAEKKVALETLRGFGQTYLTLGLLDETETFKLKTALFQLQPQRSAVAEVRENMQDKLARMFGTKKTITGIDVYGFEGCHYGAADMARNIKLAIKSGTPEKRLWIEYNGKADEYTILGQGAEAPFGWAGYVPADAEATEAISAEA
jgi:hypothetical protein